MAIAELNRDVRKAKRQLEKMTNGTFVVLDGDTMEAVKETLMESLLAAVDKVVETIPQPTDTQVSLDPKALEPLKEAIAKMVDSIPVPEKKEPASYTIDNIQTDRSGNILSADIKPIKG